MANPLQIKTRTTVIKDQMTALLRELALSYELGEIKSPAEMHHQVYEKLQAFFESIGKNTFKPIKAWGPPYSADHNQMVKQMLADFHTLYAEVNLMTVDLTSNYEQIELERQSFLARLSQIESLTKSIAGNIQEADFTSVHREDFTDYSSFAKEATQLTPASLSPDEGLLTLAKTDGNTYNEYATITVLEGNGFPGNTHVVRSNNNALKFDGQEEMHINLADVLDGNGDTWFEYERFELTESTQKTTMNMGFQYKEALDWISSEGGIYCVLKIEFNKPKMLNWVSLSPFLPPDRGVSAATIEKIIVTDDKGSVSTMGEGDIFISGLGYLFPRQNCKTVLIYLRQDQSYATMIGHFYFKQISTDNVAIMNEKVEQEGVRIHGPAASVQNLGVAYDTGARSMVYPIAAYGATILDSDKKKKELFTVPPTPSNVHGGLEQVSAYRYAIGLRDVYLASYTFERESEYVSIPLYSSTPITRIEVDVDADVPAIFMTSSERAEWINYYISIDQGQNWLPIYPRDTYQAGAITKYLINSGVSKEGRSEETGYIDLNNDVHQVQFKIELRRPATGDNFAYYTPIVYSYNLYVTMAEELI